MDLSFILTMVAIVGWSGSIVILVCIKLARSNITAFPIGIHDNLATTLTADDWQRMLRAYVAHVKEESGRNYIYAEESRGSKFMYALTDKQYDNLKNICRRDF